MGLTEGDGLRGWKRAVLCMAALTCKLLEARLQLTLLPYQGSCQQSAAFPLSGSLAPRPLDLSFSIYTDQMTSKVRSTLTHPLESQPGKEFQGPFN